MATNIRSPDNRFNVPIRLLLVSLLRRTESNFALRPTEKADEELACLLWPDHAKVLAMVQSLHTKRSPKLANCSSLYVAATASTGLSPLHPIMVRQTTNQNQHFGRCCPHTHYAIFTRLHESPDCQQNKSPNSRDPMKRDVGAMFFCLRSLKRESPTNTQQYQLITE